MKILVRLRVAYAYVLMKPASVRGEICCEDVKTYQITIIWRKDKKKKNSRKESITWSKPSCSMRRFQRVDYFWNYSFAFSIRTSFFKLLIKFFNFSKTKISKFEFQPG